MENILKSLIEVLSGLDDDARIIALNEIKISLHNISPLKDEPVDCVLWVKNDAIIANDYNPNQVAPPEMDLLSISIDEDGYTQPIVTVKGPNNGDYTVIDGFHRNRVGKENKSIEARVKGYLPITIIREDREGRCDMIASTIRHNRARGKHSITGMTNIIVELKRRNWSNVKIGRELGMDADEVLRLSQISGLAEMFKDHEFTEAWTTENILDIDTTFEDLNLLNGDS